MERQKKRADVCFDCFNSIFVFGSGEGNSSISFVVGASVTTSMKTLDECALTWRVKQSARKKTNM
jgi:hypothetical protein